MSALASKTRCSGERKKGSVMTPCSLRFTLSTWLACSSIVMFLWMMPRPPSRASAMPMRESVTVSMAADRRGMLSLIFSDSCTDRSTSRGSTALLRGTSSTSSNVKPSRRLCSSILTLQILIRSIVVSYKQFWAVCKAIIEHGYNRQGNANPQHNQVNGRAQGSKLLVEKAQN